MAECMQFISENRPNECQIFLETESEPNFGFPHIPTAQVLEIKIFYWNAVVTGWNDMM